jgi:hypothetical protein
MAGNILPPAFDPYRGVFLFIVGSLGLGVAGNAAYDLLTGTETDRRLLVALLLGAPLGGVIFGYLVARLVRLALAVFPRDRVAIVQGEEIAPRRALVLFVSAGLGTSHERVFAHHLHDPASPVVAHCWLMHSTHPESAAKAERFREERQRALGQRVVFHPCAPLPTVTDMKVAHDAYETAIDAALAIPGLTRQDLIVDVTGGTGIVTAGAVLACLDRGVDAEYVRQEAGVSPIIWVDLRWATAPPPSRPLIVGD